jgi:TonB family protein
MDVTDVLRDRTGEPEGLRAMVLTSVALHVLLGVTIMVAPDAWFPARQAEPRSIMTITLGGGTPGPATGGMTSIAGRAVQAQAPPEPERRPPPLRPPAAKPPEMTLPAAKPAAPAASPPPEVKQAPPEARGRTPSQGAEPAPGSAVAETGARGQGFGLSTGGGGGSGSRLDVADFCCPEYIVTMVERIRVNWDQRAEVPGEVLVMFTIQRDGSLTDVAVERSSGYIALDLGAHRAILNARQLPPLPAAFPNPTLTVHLNFQYTR